MKSARNSLGYQCLNEDMTAKILGTSDDIRSKILSEIEKNNVLSNLQSFSIENPENKPDDSNLYNQSFNCEPLLKNNIEQHFEAMASSQVKELESLLHQFAELKPVSLPLHYQNITKGWNFFNGESWEISSVPSESVIVFDTETFVQAGNFAIIATIFSSRGYYIWVHEAFHDDTVPYTSQLLNLGPHVKIAIGVNVCFDAARVEESYLLQQPSIAYIDTRSMFQICHGLTSDLMKTFTTYKWNEHMNPYCKHGSKASLLDSYNFYYRKTEPMDEGSKKIRDVFVNCSTINEMVEVAGGRETLYEYAIKDCYYTFKIFKKVFYEFLYYSPSPVSFSAMVILGSPKPALDNNWYEWIQNCENLYLKALTTITDSLSLMADELYTEFKENDALDVDSDPWYRDLSWYMDTATVNKTIRTYEIYQASSNVPLLVNVPHGEQVAKYIEHIHGHLNLLKTSSGKIKAKKVTESIKTIPRNEKSYGKPEWYVKSKKSPITTKSILAHYLCGLSWRGFPIYKTRDKGFCYRDEYAVEHKIPHKKGGDANVGGLLSKDFIHYFNNGTLTARNPRALELMNASASIAYWTSVRSRITDVLTWKVPNPLNNNELTLMTSGQVVPANTVSGRTGQRLLNTVPSIKKDKIGTELKTMFTAPMNWKIVGADIDGEEQQIFAMFADSKIGVSGSSPVGSVVLTGSKENKDDYHYLMANKAGIDRKTAKFVNYGINYGAGIKTVSKTIALSNPSMLEAERNSLSTKIIEIAKGYRSGNRFYNGTSSEGFNFINDLLASDDVKTSFLHTKISAALNPRNDIQDRNYMSNQNWSIQAAGTNFLHCILCACKYLNSKYNLGALFMISLHDEIFYLVPEANAEKFAACFLQAHIWTWALFQYKLGLYDLPLQRMFISGIYVGNKWVKELGDNVTVSNNTNTVEGKEYKHKELIPIMNKLFS